MQKNTFKIGKVETINIHYHAGEKPGQRIYPNMTQQKIIEAIKEMSPILQQFFIDLIEWLSRQEDGVRFNELRRALKAN